MENDAREDLYEYDGRSLTFPGVCFGIRGMAFVWTLAFDLLSFSRLARYVLLTGHFTLLLETSEMNRLKG